MVVKCSIEQVTIPANETGVGVSLEGVEATCGECEHSVRCNGIYGPSRRRALLMLRETCPEGASNFYKDEDE